MTKSYREGENANGLFYDVVLQVATQRLVNHTLDDTNLGEEPGETPGPWSQIEIKQLISAVV